MNVVIPVKNRLDLTKRLIRDLLGEPGVERILVFDNGSDDGTWEWLAGQPVESYLRPGANLYAMWNEGRLRSQGVVGIFNNDITLAPGCIQAMQEALWNEPLLGVVCPTPTGDGLAEGVIETTWFLGYCFAVRPEVCAMFDTRYQWYYGDTDYAHAIRAEGYWCGLLRTHHVAHIGGASTPPNLVAETIDADRALFEEKWLA